MTYKCEECGVEKGGKQLLVSHIRQHHREHKYKCSYCSKTFVTPYKLKVIVTAEMIDINSRITNIFHIFFLQMHEESHTRHNTYQVI